MTSVSPNIRVRRVGSQFLDAELDGELVLMNVDDGDIYGLRHTALRAWKLINEGGAWTPLGGLITSHCEEFEVDAATCLKDLAALLDDLCDVGLAEVEH